jgi:transposase
MFVDGGGSPAIVAPQEVLSYEFGMVADLYKIAHELKLVDIINKHVEKKNVGISVGEYVLLAALNRAICPRSKRQIADWYKDTVLKRILSIPCSLLTSQNFWDNFDKIDEDTIEAIEQDITDRVIQKFGINMDILFYDTTNFFTYMDELTECELARRGHSKDKQFSRRIVGLALMINHKEQLPLFHKTYPGNFNDAGLFGQIIQSLLMRIKRWQPDTNRVTLVIDKGNNSERNLNNFDWSSHYRVVGSLHPSRYQDLMKISLRQFKKLPGNPDRLYYTTHEDVAGESKRIVITIHMPTYKYRLYRLKESWISTEAALNKLRGASHMGRYSEKNIINKKLETLWKNHSQMQKVFKTHIIEVNGKFHLEYETIKSKMKELREGLARTLIFTNNPKFSEQDMVEAYFGKSDIENQFREMKDPHHIAVKPIRHFTDTMIRVHLFTCVIALLLRNLLITKVQKAKVDIERIDIFKHLEEIKESVLLYLPPNPPMRKLTKLDETKKKLFQILNLDNWK